MRQISIKEIEQAGYIIQSNGRIRGKDGNILSIAKIGYCRHGLSVNGKTYYFYAHQLVALKYLPNTENKRCVNHKDGNKKNNHISNLEWCTHQENTDHAILSGLQSPYKSLSKSWESKRKLILDLSNGVFYSCSREAAEAVGLTRSYLKSMLGGDSRNKTTLIYC